MFFTTPVEDGLCFSQSAQFIRHRKFHKHKFHNNLTALTYVFLDTFCESEKRVKINTPALIMRMRTYAVNEKTCYCAQLSVSGSELHYKSVIVYCYFIDNFDILKKQ